MVEHISLFIQQPYTKQLKGSGNLKKKKTKENVNPRMTERHKHQKLSRHDMQFLWNFEFECIIFFYENTFNFESLFCTRNIARKNDVK